MPTPPTRLRPIQATDNSVVAHIIRQVMTEFACVGDGYSIHDPEVDQMHEAYKGPQRAFYVIEQVGQVLGCGGFGPLSGGDSDTCELKKMYFLPALRGAGWGRRMLQHCMDEARKMGYQRMYLETVNRMVAANALYQSFGFEPLARPMGATGHGGCDTYYLLEL
ncbi:MAG: GNAT family N-acetyltransferase [Bacteroidetes bacterium]|nr:MAG: GNAT family N-acetyltransferase [Bacteroidota bacterium]